MTDRIAKQPLLIAAAPNGAYKTRADHPALPLTAAQLASVAEEVLRAGARMLHLHVRDEHGAHTLDEHAYRTAIDAVRAQVGARLFIQATSESARHYAAADQCRALRALCAHDAPDGVSIAPRELIRTADDVAAAGALFNFLRARDVLIQYILYSRDEVDAYCALRKRGVIPADKHCVLLVVGRRGLSVTVATATVDSTVDATDDATVNEKKYSPIDALHEMQAALGESVQWMVCAFGDGEFDCLTEATRLGGHVRVGFENALTLKNGARAANNGALIAQLTQFGNPLARPLASGAQVAQLLGAD